MATFDSTVIARLATGLYSTQIGNATMAEALAAVNGNAYGSVDALANALYARDFAGMTNAAVADMIVKNVGLTGALATEGAGVVKGVLDGAAAGQKGAAISNLLTSFSTLTAPAFADVVAAFNHQIHLAVEYAQTANTADVALSDLVRPIFTIAEETGLGGLKAMRLTGTQDVRIDFTNPANQITGLDLDNDGLIEANGVENRITGVAANYGAVDAYARNPWNHFDTANNFLGDIAYDGTGFQGDGVSTNGNVFLGGLGADTALGGIGNDFLAGGGIAQNHGGIDRLSGGRNADFFFAELSLLSPTDGSSPVGNGTTASQATRLVIDGGTTADNSSAGSAQTPQDADWLLLEVSDDDEPVTIALRDDSLVDPAFLRPVLNDGIHGGVGDVSGVIQSEGGTGSLGNPLAYDRVGYVITRSGVPIGTLRDIENFDASGNLYGFLDKIDVEIGARAMDDRDTAGTSNYGIGSSAQLRVVGSNVDNIIIGSYDNDLLQGAAGNDLMFGGNLKQLLETVAGKTTNSNLSAIPNDGADALYGGVGNDNLVFEADGAVVDGDNAGPNIADADLPAPVGSNTSDTLWLTKYALGTGTAATVTTDGVLRFDLTSQNRQTEGSVNEGAAGYGGSNTAGTQDQTNYATAVAPGFSKRVSVTNMENVDATGLGAIDYFAAGTNRPETTFTNHQNFEGYNGNLTLRGTNGPTVLDNVSADAAIVADRGAKAGSGNNNLYAGFGNDILEGRGNNVPVAGTTAVTQIDDLEGNKGNDDFYIAIDGDFAVGGASGGVLGGTAIPGVAGAVFNASAGDGYDVIRRKIDANNDGFWDQLPASTNQQNPSNGAFVWGQDFGLDSDSTPGTSVLTIDIQKAGGNTPGLELGQVVNAVTAVVTGVKQADGTFKPVVLNAADITAARTYADLLKAIQAGLKANTEFGADLTATLDANGHKITIVDAKGRELADAFSEGGAGVAVQQLANTATENVFAFGPATVTTVQDRLIYKSYEDRTDNEGMDDNVELGSWVSLGTDAYAQDLVISFQRDTSTTFGTGTTTFVAEDQNWTINFDNLTTQDRVSIAVNGVTYTLQVGVQLDGTIIPGEDTNFVGLTQAAQVAIQTAFLGRLAGYINSFSDDDTAAGSIRALGTATQIRLLQNQYSDGEQTVYMRAPEVTVENLSGGQAPFRPVWDNPATSASEGTGIVNASQSEVQLYQFDGRNAKLDTANVKFWGQEEVQRSVLVTAKDAGGKLTGIDSWIVDGEVNTIRAAGDLAPTVANAAAALIDAKLNEVNDRLVTTNSALNVNFAVHGDDLLLSGPGVDEIKGGTGDDRIIGSVGGPVAPALGVTTGGEILDGGKNYYAVKLLDEDLARVYVLNRWEAGSSNIVSVLPELAGKVITSITSIGQTEDGTAVFNKVATAPNVFNPVTGNENGTFRDTLQYQQEDFGAGARFMITLDDFQIADVSVPGVPAGRVVQQKNDGAGLVSIDANNDKVYESFARFTNFENIRTVSGTGAANAATPGVANSGGQGDDTLDISKLSNDTSGSGFNAAGGVSYDLTNRASAGAVNYSVDAHANGKPAAATATVADTALGINRPQEADYETLLIRVDGVENVIAGLGDDLLIIDETEAAKNNSFTGGLGEDRIDYQSNWTVGVVGADAEPVVTINVESSANVDKVVMTGGRLGSVVATDTLDSVEFITLTLPPATAAAAAAGLGGFTGAGRQERDVLNVTGVIGATVDYNDLIQSSAATVTTGTAPALVTTAKGTGVANSGTIRSSTGNIVLTVENLFQIENVIGSTGDDTVKLADRDVMVLNSREDVADAMVEGPVTFATFMDFDTVSVTAAVAPATLPTVKRVAFIDQRALVPDATGNGIAIENVRNNGQYTFDLGAGGSDTVDYSNTNDNISAVVELDATKERQFVLIDADGANFWGAGPGDLLAAGDRIDVLRNVERIVASQGESVLDLSSSTKGLEIKFNPVSQQIPRSDTLNGFDVSSVRISDLSTASPLTRSYVEYRDTPATSPALPAGTLDPNNDPKLKTIAPATWSRIEGSDNAEVVILNSDHSFDNNTFNLRGGANQVKYNELTRSIMTTLSVVDFDPADVAGSVASGFVPQLYASTNPNAVTQQKGTVMAVTQFQDGNSSVTPPAVFFNALTGGGTHVVTSYTGNNLIAPNSSLRIAASQDAEDTLIIQGNSAKIFLLAETGTADNQITVTIGGSTNKNTVVLTGYEVLLDDGGTNDLYNIDNLINAALGTKLIDNPFTNDHDVIKVRDNAINFAGSGLNTISLASLDNTFFYDFDVLDVSAVAASNVILVGANNVLAPANVGPAGNVDIDITDEVVLGALSKVRSITDFEAVILSDATVAAGASFSWNATAGTLTQGSTTVPITNGVHTLSFGGNVLEGTNRNLSIPDVAAAVTLTITGVGAAGTNQVYGGAGADTITGSGFGDIIVGNGGNDVLDGGTAAEVRQIQINPTGVSGAAGTTIVASLDGFILALNNVAAIVDTDANLGDNVDILANQGSVKVGDELAKLINANLADINNGVRFGGQALLNATFNNLTMTFTFAAGKDVPTASAIFIGGAGLGGVTVDVESTQTNGSDGGSDAFVFSKTAAANGVDVINNFVSAGGASDDKLVFTDFLGGAAVLAAAPASAAAGLSTLGAPNVGILFNKTGATLAAGDISLAAAAGKVAVEDNGKAVILVTADADGVSDTTVTPYLVYYVEDTNPSPTVQTYVVTQVATLNSVNEVGTATLTAAKFVAPAAPTTPVGPAPTMTPVALPATVNEDGATVNFTANTTLPEGSVVNYTVAGTAATTTDTNLTAAQIAGGGTVTVAGGKVTLPVQIKADTTTEAGANETLSVTFTSGALTSTISTAVVDTSQAGGGVVFTDVPLAAGTTALAANAAVAENFIFDFKMVGGRATVVDGNVTITGFSTANDKLTFNDTGAGTLLTEAQFKVLLGVSIAENPFANETTISMDPDGVNTGSVKLVGIVDAALNQIVVETTP